jgi:hypothetical protein
MRYIVMRLQQANDLASHRWTAYVRGNGNEDITHIVQKVCQQCCRQQQQQQQQYRTCDGGIANCSSKAG